MMRLLRYNFRVLMFRNWWLLVFPIAASQLAVFWNLITLRFTAHLPTQSVEMVSPILAAFLSAHMLSAEYRSGVGAIVASKPIDIGKIVLLRLLMILALIWVLAGLTLTAFYYGWEPYRVGPAILACIPSTLFLSVLALFFATMFRNAWAGFAVAAVWWALDLAPGLAMQPLLSLRSVSASMVSEMEHKTYVLTRLAWEPKAVLLLGTLVLYRLHAGLVFTLGSPHAQRYRRRGIWLAFALPILYVASGAALKVGYLYTHRGNLIPDDTSWIRRHFASYGPLPVAWLFGPSFAAYVGDIPNTWRLQQGDETDALGASITRRRRIAEIVKRAGGGIWASNIADLHGRLAVQGVLDPAERIRLTRLVADRYPHGPHAAAALVRAARECIDIEDYSAAQQACETALSSRPNPKTASEALRLLAQLHSQAGRWADVERTARAWIKIADARMRFMAAEALFDSLLKQNKRDAAAEAVVQGLEAVREFRKEVLGGGSTSSAGRDTPLAMDVDRVERKLREFSP